MNPMLLHILQSARLGGCERNCECVIRETPDVDSRILVLSTETPLVATWRERGIKVFCVDIGSSRVLAYKKVRAFVSTMRPDAAILWSSARLGLLASACWAGGVGKLVAHVGNPVEIGLFNRVAGIAYSLLPGSRAAKLVAASRHVARSIERERLYRDYDLRVIHNAVSVDHCHLPPAVPQGQDLRVGMIARLDGIKDHGTLLRAWQQVLKIAPNASLELVGDGHLRGKLELLSRELQIDHSVRFLGWLSNLTPVVAGWNLVVHSTTEREGLGNAMLEAMSSGRPLVATDIGPVREITWDGKAAVLVPPGDCDFLARSILEVASDPAAALRLVGVARELMVREFSASVMAAGYLGALGLHLEVEAEA